MPSGFLGPETLGWSCFSWNTKRCAQSASIWNILNLKKHPMFGRAQPNTWTEEKCNMRLRQASKHTTSPTLVSCTTVRFFTWKPFQGKNLEQLLFQNEILERLLWYGGLLKRSWHGSLTIVHKCSLQICCPSWNLLAVAHGQLSRTPFGWVTAKCMFGIWNSANHPHKFITMPLVKGKTPRALRLKEILLITFYAVLVSAIHIPYIDQDGKGVELTLWKSCNISEKVGHWPSWILFLPLNWATAWAQVFLGSRLESPSQKSELKRDSKCHWFHSSSIRFSLVFETAVWINKQLLQEWLMLMSLHPARTGPCWRRCKNLPCDRGRRCHVRFREKNTVNALNIKPI